MIKTLTTIGNSKAIIIPKRMIEKYQLDRLSLKETKDGILIVPEAATPTFHEKVEMLRKSKETVYERMKSQANAPEVIKYYDQSDLEDVDVEIED